MFLFWLLECFQSCSDSPGFGKMLTSHAIGRIGPDCQMFSLSMANREVLLTWVTKQNQEIPELIGTSSSSIFWIWLKHHSLGLFLFLSISTWPGSLFDVAIGPGPSSRHWSFCCVPLPRASRTWRKAYETHGRLNSQLERIHNCQSLQFSMPSRQLWWTNICGLLVRLYKWLCSITTEECVKLHQSTFSTL